MSRLFLHLAAWIVWGVAVFLVCSVLFVDIAAFMQHAPEFDAPFPDRAKVLGVAFVVLHLVRFLLVGAGIQQAFKPGPFYFGRQPEPSAPRLDLAGAERARSDAAPRMAA